MSKILELFMNGKEILTKGNDFFFLSPVQIECLFCTFSIFYSTMNANEIFEPEDTHAATR